MKARLLINNNVLQLLLCTGAIRIVTISEAKQFILSFDDPSHYEGPDTWDYEGISMETYDGNTVALVDDKGILHIHDAEEFRKIIAYVGPKLLTVSEFSALHGRKHAIVRRYCAEGRIPGAIQKANRWLIPENAAYPIDSSEDES